VTGYKLDNLTVLTENNAIGNVVIAGFWESDVIAALLAGEPKKIIMFEPDKALYATASANYANKSNVEVHNATLSDKTGEAECFVFTPNRFSSLLRPKQLLKIYRKNSNENVISINVSTVQSVCEQQKILPSAGNILLLGVNCPSTILSDAVQTDHLSYFDVIIVRQPKQGLYESEQQQDTLSTVLQENKFIVLQELSHDPMYSQFVYRRDHQGEKINALQAKVTAAESQNAEVAKQLAEAESRSSQFKSSATELNTNYSKLKAQCEVLTANAETLEIKGTELATQNTQLDTALTQIKAQNDKLSGDSAQKLTQNEQLAAQISALQAKHNELAETQKNKDTQIAELTAQRDQQAKGHQETKQQAELLKAQNEKLSADRAQKLTASEQLTAQITALQSKHNELVETQKNKDTQIAELTAQRDQQAKGHQETKQQAELLKAQNEKLSADKAQKLTANEQLAAQITALQSKHNELAETQKNKDAKIAELIQQYDQKTKGHQETSQQAESLKAQNEKLIADKVQKLKDNEQMAVQVTALQNKQNELVDGHKTKDAQIAKLTAQFDQQAKGQQETKQQAESLKAQIEKLSADKAQKLTDNETMSVQVTALQNKQNELVDGHKNKDAQIAELTVQRDQQTEGHQEVKQKFNELVSQKVELENKLKTKNEQDDTAKKLNDLLAQVQNQNNVMKKNHDGIAKKLEYGFKNTVKQVESFIGVQSYLETGQLAMEYHGWPISSDVALFLLSKVEKNNYDLIIEFGSGTSTQLFAKAINNQLKAQGRHADEDLALISRDKGDSYARSALHRELPNRIVTFEHNKKYYNKTTAELEANKLSHLVDLVHAPLIEMKIENEDYLYYSCEHKLSQLAAIYAERTVKILVLIDGPPESTGPLARLPAVPLLLNYLGKHQLDLVLDDYNRPEEKEAVGRWKKLFEKRALAYDEEIVPCEKGAFFCSVNP
jgi:FkbM family methyltransferase